MSPHGQTSGRRNNQPGPACKPHVSFTDTMSSMKSSRSSGKKSCYQPDSPRNSRRAKGGRLSPRPGSPRGLPSPRAGSPNPRCCTRCRAEAIKLAANAPFPFQPSMEERLEESMDTGFSAHGGPIPRRRADSPSRASSPATKAEDLRRLLHEPKWAMDGISRTSSKSQAAAHDNDNDRRQAGRQQRSPRQTNTVSAVSRSTKRVVVAGQQIIVDSDRMNGYYNGSVYFHERNGGA